MAEARFIGWEAPFSLLGVRLRVHASWAIIAILIAWSLASGSLPLIYEGLPSGAYWTMAVLIVLGLALSIVLHELAHTLVGRALGMSVDRITLFLFGGVAELKDEPKRASAELMMALAGPAFSVAFAALLALTAGLATTAEGPRSLVLALGYLSTLNLVLAAFNMTPAFPLDGGRVLRAVVWMVSRDLEKATRFASRIGAGFGVLLMAAGFAAVFLTGVAGGLWWILIGLFIYSAARGSLADIDAKRAFSGQGVRDVMVREVESVPPQMALDRFVEDRLMASRHELYPVVEDGALKGIVLASDVLRAPHAKWSATTIGEICTAADQASMASPDDDVAEVLDRMRTQDSPRLLVVEGNAVVGIVTLKDLLGRLELRRRLGLTLQGQP